RAPSPLRHRLRGGPECLAVSDRRARTAWRSMSHWPFVFNRLVVNLLVKWIGCLSLSSAGQSSTRSPGLLSGRTWPIKSAMNRAELLGFLRRYKLCVQSSVGADGAPQCAVVGYAVTDELEIVFDTVGTTRKMRNLRRDPRIALVVGWDEET